MPLPNNEEWGEWDFNLRVAVNRVNGVYSENKYGYNPSINNTPEDVWNQGGVLSYLTSAETMDIASSSADDDGSPLGIGAHQIQIFGVSQNYTPLQETVTLNGTNTVTTVSPFLRINRMRVLGSGSNDTNVGTITATASTAGTVQANIGPNLGSTVKSQYTVPENYYAYILLWSISTLNNDQVQADLQTREEGGSWITRNRLTFVENAVNQRFFSPLAAPPHSDIRVQAVRIAGSGNVVVSTNYEFYLVRQAYVSLGNGVSATLG